MTSMRSPTHPQWLLALGGWTFFVWFQRIGNVLDDDELAGVAQTWRLAVAVVFVVTAVVLVAGVWRSRAGRSGEDSVEAIVPPGSAGQLASGPWPSTLGLGLAAVGSAWWIVRGGLILFGDWDASFKLVHTVLAVIVVGLSVMVWRTRGYDRHRYG